MGKLLLHVLGNVRGEGVIINLLHTHGRFDVMLVILGNGNNIIPHELYRARGCADYFTGTRGFQLVELTVR